MEKATMNSGMRIQSSNGGSSQGDFYGLLDQIIEIEYYRSLMWVVLLSACGLILSKE